MALKKTKYSCRPGEIIQLARELRIKLHEIDQKLEHLIRSQRHFYSLHYKERELDD
jgi:hypothetical protein